MIKKMWLLFIFVWCAVQSPILGSPIYWGVLWYKDSEGGQGNPMTGEYQPKLRCFRSLTGKGDEFSAQVEKLMHNFKLRKPYPGVTSIGEKRNIIIDSKTYPQGEGLLLFTAKKEAKNFPVLFWTDPSLKLEILKSEKINIDPKEIIILKSKIRELIQQARNQLREPTYKLSRILEPTILKPEKENNLVTIFFPIILEASTDSKYLDKRSSAFFLYDSSKKKILLSRFGHPEWSPDTDGIEVIEPINFFKLDEKIYFFSRYEGTWEYSGYAIFELGTGKKMLETY